MRAIGNNNALHSGFLLIEWIIAALASGEEVQFFFFQEEFH
jgi:hypothetical protein